MRYLIQATYTVTYSARRWIIANSRARALASAEHDDEEIYKLPTISSTTKFKVLTPEFEKGETK